jgi:beta-N-acetylhexosaminidase
MKGATSFCTIAGCAARSLEAGADLILLGRYIKPLTLFAQIHEIVQKKNLYSRVEDAAKRIFELKKQLGLLEHTPRVMVAPLDKAYRTTLEDISKESVTLVRDYNGLIPFASAKQRPTVCTVFFAPPRFADQLMHVSKPFLARDYHVRTYNAPLSPHEKDVTRALKCAEGADLVVVASLQWADKINLSQKHTIEKLLAQNPKLVLLSVMSPYDIVHYPTVGTILATYGLNSYSLQTAADVIVGNTQARGVMPVELPNAEASGNVRTRK